MRALVAQAASSGQVPQCLRLRPAHHWHTTAAGAHPAGRPSLALYSLVQSRHRLSVSLSPSESESALPGRGASLASALLGRGVRADSALPGTGVRPESALPGGRKRGITASARGAGTRTEGGEAGSPPPSPSEARGSSPALPRFFCESLPLLQGQTVAVAAAEALHMTRSLRLGVGAKVELFDGKGHLAPACIASAGAPRRDLVLELTGDREFRQWGGRRWIVAAAAGGLKGGRADWLIEKCTELGAFGLIPLLTARSPRAGEGRIERWQRVAQAASKQCYRVHTLQVWEPTELKRLLKTPTPQSSPTSSPSLTDSHSHSDPQSPSHSRSQPHSDSSSEAASVNGSFPLAAQTAATECHSTSSQAGSASGASSGGGTGTGTQLPLLVAQAGAPPLLQLLMGRSPQASTGAGGGGSGVAEVPLRERFREGGILLVGPEGDFAPEELAMLESAGAMFAGLGSNRLRVETAALALLAGVQLLEDSDL